LAWGGEEERLEEVKAGNRDAKNWQAEAMRVLEAHVSAAKPHSLSTKATKKRTSHLSDYNAHRKKKIAQAKQEEGWQVELRRFLNETFPDVNEHSDIIKLWQDIHVNYPTLGRLALNVLPVQASSVPCERLFSGSKQTASDRRARLGSDRFEELQLMKFAWRRNLTDIAAWNSQQVEEVDLDIADFQELLREEEDSLKWDREDLDHFAIGDGPTSFVGYSST
ncbi:hypothetical protein M378DRAFT_88744, partial [Amanita muscaria Koide BX008]